MTSAPEFAHGDQVVLMTDFDRQGIVVALVYLVSETLYRVRWHDNVLREHHGYELLSMAMMEEELKQEMSEFEEEDPENDYE